MDSPEIPIKTSCCQEKGAKEGCCQEKGAKEGCCQEKGASEEGGEEGGEEAIEKTEYEKALETPLSEYPTDFLRSQIEIINGELLKLIEGPSKLQLKAVEKQGTTWDDKLWAVLRTRIDYEVEYIKRHHHKYKS